MFILLNINDVIALNHKFYKNCLGCGLIFCQQNSKLQNCTFCALSFDKLPGKVSSPNSHSLEKAVQLQSRLLTADSEKNCVSTIKDEYDNNLENSFVQTKFCSASEIIARKREIEGYKAKLALDQEQKSSLELSKMLDF